MTNERKSCCCPATSELAGEYIHDDGPLQGQFRRTLTLREDGTFKYDKNADLGVFYSVGAWSVVAQGGKCFVQLVSDSVEGQNELIYLFFDRSLLEIDGVCLNSEPQAQADALRLCRRSSLFPDGS